jgi:hypothetical protein
MASRTAPPLIDVHSDLYHSINTGSESQSQVTWDELQRENDSSDEESERTRSHGRSQGLKPCHMHADFSISNQLEVYMTVYLCTRAREKGRLRL